MRLSILLLTAALPLATKAEVIISHPWARASILASRPGAAYFTVASDSGDRLLDVTTPVAEQAMIHAVETDGTGVGRMQHLDALDVPAGGSVTLAPGGMHLMLVDLTRKLEEGASFPLTFRFQTAGEVTFEVPVLSVAAAGPEEAAE